MGDYNFLKLANDRAEQERAMKRMQGHIDMLEEENIRLQRQVSQLEAMNAKLEYEAEFGKEDETDE